MFTLAQISVDEIWNQPRGYIKDKQIKEMWHIFEIIWFTGNQMKL